MMTVWLPRERWRGSSSTPLPVPRPRLLICHPCAIMTSLRRIIRSSSNAKMVSLRPCFSTLAFHFLTGLVEVASSKIEYCTASRVPR